ncbi:MAG: pilus assembly protein TadG-related protein [Bryobacteraceae bacterium]|jgi:hypothetical protein
MKRGERGVTVLLAAGMMMGLLELAGLAVDVGYLQVTRLRAQAAADAAAEGALFELKNDNTDLTGAGQHDAALNGFTNGVNSTTVTVNSPPLSGSFAGQSQGVEAIVTRSVSTFFMGLLGFRTVNVTGYAAGVLPSASLGCVYALDSTASKALQIDGSSATFNCGAVVESNSSSAFYMEGAGTLTMAANTTVGVVGPSDCSAASPALTSGCGVDMAGQTQVCPASGSCSSSTYPTASGISNPGDPFASVAAPSMTGLTEYAATSAWDMNHEPASNTFQPGIYCGGITVNNTNGATFTFAAGTYVLAGGGLNLQGQSIVSGTGVTFYNTSAVDVQTAGGALCSGSPAFSPMNINGQATATLSAPTTGSLTGILIFQDRSLGTSSTENQIVGDADTVLNGALYFKNSNITFSGNSSSTGYTTLVADTVTINGSSTLNQNNSPLSSGGTARAIPVLGQ